MHVAAEPDRQPARDHFERAAGGIPRIAAAIDLRDHVDLGIEVGAAQRRVGADVARRFECDAQRRVEADAVDAIHVADDLDVERSKQLPGNRARRDTRRGLAGARALEHVANIGAVVFDDAGKVGMPRTRPRDDRPDRAGRSRRRLILGMHRLLPVFPILVANEQRDGRAERFAGAHARENLGLVGFDRHAAAAAVSTLTPLELFGDGVEIDMQSGRHALENDDEPLAVRLAGGEKTQHCLAILYEVSALFRSRTGAIAACFRGRADCRYARVAWPH